MEVGTDASGKKTRIMGLPDCQNSFKTFSRLNTTAASDGQTRTQTHIHVTSVVCLTSVCHVHRAYKSRTERPRKTKIGTEVAHVTRDSDTTFKVKGQGHRAALLTTVLARQAAAAMGVRTCWPWKTAATLTLPSKRRRKALRRPRGEERGGAYSLPWRPLAYSLLNRPTRNCRPTAIVLCS